MENNQGQPSQEGLDRLFENRNDHNVISAFNHHYGDKSAEQYFDDTASTNLENEAVGIPEGDIEYLQQNADNTLTQTALDTLHADGP